MFPAFTRLARMSIVLIVVLSVFSTMYLRDEQASYHCIKPYIVVKKVYLHCRDFIENHLLEFVKKNPGIVVYLQPRRHRTPRLVAEYCTWLNLFSSICSLFCKYLQTWLT
jgi:Mitochondrial ribosomal protein L51 / S25 / CI-B8 domain